MEKRGVIEPGVTPPEHETPPNKEKRSAAAIDILDADFRKRAADAAATKPNSK